MDFGQLDSAAASLTVIRFGMLNGPRPMAEDHE